jgi:NADH-quinone oxidoreductase subunit C
METVPQLKARLEAAVPGVALEVLPSTSSANQPSLLVDREHALAVARFMHDDPQLRLDYASNVTGVDWLDSVTKESEESRGWCRRNQRS